MRGKTIRILMAGSACLILVFLLLTSFLLTDYEKEIMDSLVIEATADGKTAELSLWKDETDGKYYLFLPSWFAGKSGEYMLHYSDRMAKLLIDGVEYTDKSTLKEDGREEVHELKVQGIFGNCYSSTSLQVLASEKLPSIFIAVEEKEGLLSDTEFEGKEYLESGYLKLRDEEGNLLCQAELDRFKVRGNLTAALSKKPYTFSFKEPVSVLGMEPALKWNLIANATDGSYIRNKIVMDLAQEGIESYEPSGEFAELYLNGEYQGLYLVTEAVEIAENRMEIDAAENWFVEMELDFRASEEEAQIVTNEGQTFIVHSENGVSKAELLQIEESLNDLESALFSEDGISTISGKSLEQLLDLKSFAECYLIEELSGDHDVGITSQFAYTLKGENGIWYAGPVWDFDGTMGNVNTAMFTIPEALTASVTMSRPEGNQNQNRWLSALWKHEAFQELVAELYQNGFRTLYEESLNVKIDEYVNLIERAAALDTLRWHEERLGWWFVTPEGISIPEEGGYERFDTLDASVNMVKDFMSRKLSFLDKLWIEQREFCVVEVRNPASFLNQEYNQTLYYWVEKGTAIQNLPCYENAGYSFEGYFDRQSGQQVKDGCIIEEDMVLEGRWKEGDVQ